MHGRGPGIVSACLGLALAALLATSSPTLGQSASDLQFETSKEDPAGRAGFTVTMHDVHSGRKVKLTVAYELEAGK